LTLVLGGAFGEDVALSRLVALHRAAAADPEALGRAALGLHLGHLALLLRRVQQVAEPFRASGPAVTLFAASLLAGVERPLAVGSNDVRVALRLPAQCFFFGARIITIWRPSSFGHCSTVPTSLRSASTRLSSCMPSSWCAISRPRKRSVTFVLSPSIRNRVR